MKGTILTHFAAGLFLVCFTLSSYGENVLGDYIPAVLTEQGAESPSKEVDEDALVVAEVNGEKITYRNLLDGLIIHFQHKAIEKLVHETLVSIELGTHEITISDTDIEAGIEDYMKLQGRGKTVEQILKESNHTMEDFRAMIRQDIVVPKKIMTKEGKIKEGEPINPFHIAFWVNSLQQKHTVKTIQHNKKELEPGVFAQVDDVKLGRDDVLRILQKAANIVNYKLVLDKLIENILAEDAFRKKGIEIDKQAIDEKIEEEKKKNQMYEQFLALLGSNIELKKRELYINEGIDAAINKEPAEEDLRKHYEKFKDYFCRKMVRASHLLIKAVDPFTADPLSPEAYDMALKRIKAIEGELKGGASFNALVLKYSEDEFTNKQTEIKKESTTIQVAGDMGMFPMKKGKRINQKLVDKAFTLELGEVSGPVETEFGYHLIKVTDIHPAKYVPYEEIDEKVKKNLLEDYLEDRRLSWMEEVKGKAEIKKDLSYLYKTVKARGH